MRIRKRVIAAAFLTVLFAVSGCTGAGTASVKTDGLTVVTSFYPMYIMVKNVTRDVPGVKVVDLTPPQTGCLHDYQLTTDDMKKLEGAKVLVVNGGGMESFVDKVVSQHPDIKIIEASKGMNFLPSAVPGEVNPHVWVSISGAMMEVRNIADGLAEVDGKHSGLYKANAKAYIDKLEAERQKALRELGKVKNRDIVTFHEAFPYFAQEFDLNVVAVVEREPGSEPSAGELARTIDTIKKSGAKVIFTEPQYPDKVAQAIARETGARVYVLDPAVTGPDDCDAYLKIMDRNIETLKEALN